MTNIIINNQFEALGEMSVKQYKQGAEIVVEGILQLNRYFDDIETIKTDCFMLNGVDVQSEAFGTTDKVVIYTFKAKTLNISKVYIDELLLKNMQEGE